MGIWVIVSFLLFMLFFAGVGMASMRVKKDTTDDYLVAGRGMHPALAALSAVSTWNSGYMFIGFIGFMWRYGYPAIWISVISVIGQLVAWVWLYKRIQEEGKQRGIRSLSSLVAKVKGAPEAKFAALASVSFLLIYAAAQLSSGGKALFAMLDWHQAIGIIIGFVLVVAYCYAGGIRASIWTDAAQSFVMIIGSTMLCWVALNQVDGFSGMHDSLKSIDPSLVSIFPPDLKFGVSFWLFAFFLGGLGVAGQPQVVSRIMTLDSDKDRKQACMWFFVWQTPFLFLMIVIGLASRVIFPIEGSFDPELALPLLAMDVLGAFWVGLILASIFAATMSTADSQVLACTAAITDDLFPEWSEDHKKTKLTTVVMAIVAMCISLGALWSGNNSVFSLVVLAVYGLGGMFIPLLIIRFTGYDPSTKHSLIMMICALSGVIGWRLLELNYYIFESVPGVFAAFIAHFIMCAKNKDAWLIDRIPSPRTAAAGIAALLLLVVPTEIYYLNNEPTSEAGINPDSEWLLTVDLQNFNDTQTIMINDGDTVPISFDIPSEAIAFKLFLSYDESNEAGPMPEQCDDVSLTHDTSALQQEFEEIALDDQSGQLCGNEIDMGHVALNKTSWQHYDDGVVAINGSHSYLSQILDSIQSEKDSGEITDNVRIDANQGLFPNSDSGEEVSIRLTWWSIESQSLEEVN